MAGRFFESVKFAFDWRKRNFARLYAYLVLLALAWFFAEDFLKTRLDWAALMENPIPATIYVFAIALVLTLLFSFFSAVVELLVTSMALKGARLKARKLGDWDFATYFFLDFVVLVTALSNVFNRRGLALLGLLVLSALGALATASPVFWTVAGILLAAYVFVFFYNLMRLSQTVFAFASGESDLVKAMRASLDATLGNVLWLLLYSIALFVCVGVVLLLAIGIPTAIVAYAAGGLNTLPARLFSIVLSPIIVFSMMFAGASVYSLLLKRRKKKAEWTF